MRSTQRTRKIGKEEASLRNVVLAKSFSFLLKTLFLSNLQLYVQVRMGPTPFPQVNPFIVLR